MYTRTPSMSAPKVKTISFTGGLNEELSNLELKPGECFSMLNYEEVSGELHGYKSIPGFERIDGTTVNIENPQLPGVFIDVTYPSTVPLYFPNSPSDYTVVDDTARELRRSQITSVPGVDYLKGAFDYNDDYFVIGFTESTGAHSLWVMDSTGWTAIASFPTIAEGAGIDSGVNYDVTHARLQFFPLTANNATPNDEVVVLCNGVSPAVILWKDNTGAYFCTSLVEANSPKFPAATPVLPSDPTLLEGYPERSEIFNQRLHIAYPQGTLFISHPGDPFAYDPAITSGGTFWLGSVITDLVVSPSSLTVFQKKGIDILKISEASASGFDESKETFSSKSGAIANTAQRILGRTLFCDERGITYLEAVDSYGDFDIANVSKKVQKTYNENKENIVGAVLDREKSQYIIYFKDGSGITVTCEPDYRGDFSVKSVTVFELDIPEVNTVTEVIKTSKRLITTTEDSYLRLQHYPASSFDGEYITCRFTTAFHNYGSPVSNKTFQRLLFELTATPGQVFNISALYDYRQSYIPKAEELSSDPIGWDSTPWGEGEWGSFIWGSSGVVEQSYSYITGIGVNMAIHFTNKSKHHTPHVVHNAIVMYSQGGVRW